MESVIGCYKEHRPFGEPTKGSLGKAVILQGASMIVELSSAPAPPLATMAAPALAAAAPAAGGLSHPQ